MARTCKGLLILVFCFFLAYAPASAQKKGKDIFQTVKAYAICKQWTKALETTGLAKVYAGMGKVTMFVPTDDAFAKMPKDEVDALFGKEKAKLFKMVSYHVIEDQDLKAEDLLKKGKVTNSAATPLAFKKDKDENLLVDQASITGPDVPASNGIVHLIDTLL